MKQIMGKKIGMTQVFAEDGTVTPVTVIEVEPLTVVQRKTTEIDGYEAIQVGQQAQKAHRLNKPVKGHFDKAGVEYKKYLREIRVDEDNEYQVGDEIKVDIFEAGEKVDVTGRSKGKGTQGVIKLHNFSRGRMSHGSKFHRRPGGMSAAAYPGRVFKGHRMAGRMGFDRVTIQNLEIVRIDTENNLMLIKGAIPGPKNGFVRVRSTVKSTK